MGSAKVSIAGEYEDAPSIHDQGRHVSAWMLQFAVMELDETLAIVGTATLPFFAGLIGASETMIIVITVCYVAAAIASVKRKHRRRQKQ